jgi:hypothetical protein
MTSRPPRARVILHKCVFLLMLGGMLLVVKQSEFIISYIL